MNTDFLQLCIYIRSSLKRNKAKRNKVKLNDVIRINIGSNYLKKYKVYIDIYTNCNTVKVL